MSEPIRILVAEDHLVARVGVTTIVNMQPDMTVVAEASNGQQAVELYRQHRPDVTLLDLRMPGMGGVEAAIAIRAEFPKARMIALSAFCTVLEPVTSAATFSSSFTFQSI